MKKYISHSEKETKKIAQEIAQNWENIRVIGLSGELGAGKTVFVQGFAKSLGIKDKIISPTFVLIRQHPIPNSQKTLYHTDLYRLESEEEIKQLGLEEIWQDPHNIVLIEWAEKIESLLPKNALKISIKKMGKDSRKITLSAVLMI